MSYCSVNFVRTISNLDSHDISDGDIRDLRDDVATPQLNDDIQVSVDYQNLEKLSDEKVNKVDGSNKTFYLSDLHNNGWFLGDLNDDGVVDGGDVDAYYLDSDDSRVVLNVTVDDVKTGEVSLEQSNGDAVPSGVERDDVFVTYRKSPVDLDGPSPLVKTACAQLTGAFAFTKIDVSKLEDFSIGDVTVRSQTEGFSTLRSQYLDSVRRIVDRAVIETEQNSVSIEGVFRNV